MSDVQFLVDGHAARLILSGPLTIAQASQTRSSLIDALDMLPKGDMHIDLEGVNEADSAGIQLLLCLNRTLRQEGRRVLLASCSDVIASVAWELGVATPDDCLGLPYAVTDEVPEHELA